VLSEGYRTADLARASASAAQPVVSTREMGKLVQQALTEATDRRQSMHAV
jgi:hypothetical protein